MRNTRRSGSLMLAAIAVGMLAGCSSAAPSGNSTPTPTPSAVNQEACDAFAEATAGMSDALNSDGDINEAWGGVRDQMDAASLSATGDVKDRLETLVDDWPRGSELWVYQDFDGINTMLRDIGRACVADDAEVEYHTFSSD